MSVLTFHQKNCARVLELLDAYLDAEVAAPAADEVLRHVGACAACTEELDARARLRSALRRAARGETAPDDLRARIVGEVRQDAALGARASSSRRVLAGAAAAVLVAAGAVGAMLSPATSVAPVQRTAVDPIPHDAAILRIGLGDHVHCALQRTLPDVPPTADAMTTALGPKYAGLLDLVAAHMPAGFRMVEAHTCTFQERTFVHLVCRDDATVLSVIVTRKGGERFDAADVFAVLRGSGIPLYRASLDGMEVDGVETRDHLAFVVSGLSADRSFRIAAGLMPAVCDLLAAAEA